MATTPVSRPQVAAPAAPWRSRGRLDFRLALWLAGSFVIVATATVQVYDVLRRLEIVVDTAQSNYASLVRTLAEQTAGAMQVVDIVLRDTSAGRDRQSLEDPRLNLRLRDRVLATPQIVELIVIDATGRLAGHSGTAPAQRVSWQDQPYFLAHRAPDSGLHVSEAPHRGTPAIALSRRMEDSSGKFLGVAVAFLHLDYFRRFYAAINLDTGREVRLMRPDGALLVRHPASPEQGGETLSEQALFGRLLAEGRTVALLPMPDGGGEGIYAAVPVQNYPFAVGASVSKSVVLRPWRTQVLHSAVRTTLLCLSVALLMWLVLRELKRRETAEEGLRVQTAILDELFDSAPEAIVMLDARQRVTRVNREFTSMFGYEADEAIGQPLERLIVPADLSEESARMARAANAGQRAGGETERVRKDGHRLPVSALVAPIKTASGPIAIYAIYRDISERRMAESERTRLELRLRHAEKLEAIGTMSGGIAHDFNNILSAILGYGDMALNAAPEAGPFKRYVGYVMSASHRARALVDQILSYSRSTRGRHEVVNVAARMDETLELVRASLAPEIELRTIVNNRDLAVVADPSHIHQLVMNLCTNAVHAMDGSGTLTVSLEEVAMPEPVVLSHGRLSRGDYASIAVSDTGRGIDAALVARIFEPFFTTKASGTGTGLGLALVQSIVNELGGAIAVASTPGSGSEFRVYLPLTQGAAIEQVVQDAPLPRGGGERVLVVEDEKPLMMLTEEMLAALSYEPAGFTRPADALRELRAEPGRFDLAVIDYLMPGITGTELIKQLRSIRPDLPIVLISAHTGPVLNQEAVTAGVEVILAKPLDLRELAQAVAGALARPAR